jgi:ribonuclease HI
MVQNLKAGYSVLWSNGKNSDNLCERLPLNERQKDHRALYTAVLKAVNQGIAKGFPKMIIRTDSECATKSLTIWLVFYLFIFKFFSFNIPQQSLGSTNGETMDGEPIMIRPWSTLICFRESIN